MGSIRNGARTYLNLVAKACRLSHLPGFRVGVFNILGTTQASDLFALWDPLCSFVDALVGADNWFNQADTTSEATGSEDGPRG